MKMGDYIKTLVDKKHLGVLKQYSCPVVLSALSVKYSMAMH